MARKKKEEIEVNEPVEKQEDKAIVIKKIDEEGETLVVSPNITVEAAKPAINNLKSDLVFPKKLKINVSTPLITFFVFLMTVAVLATVCCGGYAVYYIMENGIDINYGDKVDLKDYQKMVDAYESTLSDNETIITEYQDIITSYQSTLDDYASIIESQNKKIDEMITAFDNASLQSDPEDDGDDDKDALADDLFTIYYYESYSDIVNELIKFCGYEDGKDVNLVSYGVEGMDDEVLETADFVMYETGSYEYNSEDVLGYKDLGYKKGMKNAYSFGNLIDANKDSFTYVICPGYIQLKADLAEKYLGTTDPDELYEEYFCDFETMANTCNDVYKASKGKVALFAGTEDVNTMYEYALEDTDITFDEFCDIAEDSTYNAPMWGDVWYDCIYGTAKNKNAIGTVGTPWFTRWCLLDSDYSDNNMILVKAPVKFYWGGETAVVPAETSDKDKAIELIDVLMNDEEFGLTINNSFDEVFWNNKEVAGSSSFRYDLDEFIYDGQDYISFIVGMMK